jgi:hypothetical protein
MDVVYIFFECFYIVIKIFIVISMIEFNIGDNGNAWFVIEKASFVFAGFYDKIIVVIPHPQPLSHRARGALGVKILSIKFF